MVQLEQLWDHPSVVVYAVRYYAAHPDDRAELTDGRASERLEALLAGPLYSDSAE